MECHDMFLVQSLDISKEQMTTEITKEFFKKVMVEKLVDTVKLPIVYVALEQTSTSRVAHTVYVTIFFHVIFQTRT